MRVGHVGVALAAGFFLGLYAAAPGGPVRAAPPPPDAQVAVLFAPSGSQRVMETTIGQLIAGARSEILVAMYQFTSPSLIRALAARAREGLPVAVLLDGEQNSSRDRDAAGAQLAAAGAQVRYVDLPGSGAMHPKFHHKFAVIDGQYVVTGSYNWTVLGDEENHENAVIIDSEDLARSFRTQFRTIWDDGDLTRPHPSSN